MCLIRVYICVREISSVARATCHGVSFMCLFLLLRELLRIRVQAPGCLGYNKPLISACGINEQINLHIAKDSSDSSTHIISLF